MGLPVTNQSLSWKVLTHPSFYPCCLLAASGGGKLPQRGPLAAVLAPARRLPPPRHPRRRLQRRTPLRRPLNQVGTKRQNELYSEVWSLLSEFNSVDSKATLTTLNWQINPP